MVDASEAVLSIRRQCELLSLSRSSWYYEGAKESEEDLRLMRLIDEEYVRHPFLGSRRITLWLKSQGERVNRKRVGRLMGLLGLQAIYPKPRTSVTNGSHKKYPYLLRDVEILRADHVWGTDITYIPLKGGYLYLTAILDWYSRYVLSWRLSNTLDVGFCLEALEEALSGGKPEIFNSDQGVQFTSVEYTSRLLSAGVQISMDGKGRCLDNVFVERLWRTVKYEEVYLKSYENAWEAEESLRAYFRWYNEARPHSRLSNCVPKAVYEGERVTERCQ